MCRVMLLAFISRALIGRFFCYTTGLSTVLLSVSFLLAQALSLFFNFLVLSEDNARAENKPAKSGK